MTIDNDLIPYNKCRSETEDIYEHLYLLGEVITRLRKEIGDIKEAGKL